MPRTPDALETLKTDVLARVAAGGVVTAVLAGLDLPPWTASNWARRDPAFRAQLTLAVRAGRSLRLEAYDPAAAQAFLARLGAGARVAELWGEPGMPSRRTYAAWRAHPAFAEALARLRAGQRAALAERGRRGRRAYDEAVATRIYVRLWRDGSLTRVLAADPDLPCAATVRRWRREVPAFEAQIRLAIGGWRPRRARARTRCTPALTEAVAAAIVRGASLNSLGRRPDMPSVSTLYRWMRRHPEFAGVVRMAYDMREDDLGGELLRLARATPVGGVTATRRAMGPIRRALARHPRPGDGA